MKKDKDGDQELAWDSECPVAGHSAAVFSVDFSPDGNRVVSASNDTFVKIWDVATGALVSSFVGLRGAWNWIGF